MIRAIFFDFYSVWTPDKFQEYLNDARPLGDHEHAVLADLLNKYYLGECNLEYLAGVFKFKLNRPDIDKTTLTLHESDISPKVVNLMRALHSHFLKLGILANLGYMELELLQHFNTTQPLFEAILSPFSLGLKNPLLSQQIFTKALEAIGEQASTCLIVSGHDDYLAFASQFGMATIRFTNFNQLIHSLGELLANDMPSLVNPLE